MSSKREVKGRKGVMTSQDKRREAALKRQKEARRDHLRNARNLVSGGPQDQHHQQFDNVEQNPFQFEQPIEQNKTTPNQQNNSKKKSRGNRVRERRKFWASQVSTPEWMTEIPEGLNGQGSMIGSGWFVRPRPEGRRCMVIASDGKTWSRQLDGNILHRWFSDLPYGSPETNRGHGRSSKAENDFVLLDCVFDEGSCTYWILDCMSWKQTSLYDSTAEFRLFWLHQQLQQECPNISSSPSNAREEMLNGAGGGGGGETSGNSSGVVSYPMKMCPYYDCTPEGLRAAYEGHQPFLRDGLLFYLKQGFYEPGSSPLLLQWKDTFSSRYLIYSANQQAVLQVGREQSVDDTGGSGGGGGVVEDQSFSGGGGVVRGWRFDQSNQSNQCNVDNTNNNMVESEESMMNEETPTIQSIHSHSSLYLLTLEGIIVGNVDNEFALLNQIEEGDLLKFDIDGVVVHDDDEDDEGSSNCLLVNPRFKGKSSPNRALADSWSKLLFHFRARTTPEPTINQILEMCQTPVLR